MMTIRVSIKSYLVPYLHSVGAEIGTSDFTEVVNHLLRESKRQSSGHQTLDIQVQPPVTNDDNLLADSLLELI